MVFNTQLVQQKMTFVDYLSFFEAIAEENSDLVDAYSANNLLEYTKKNWAFQNEVQKFVSISAKLYNLISKMEGYRMIAISEPWCFDAAANLPAFYAIEVASQGAISLEVCLRDSNPDLIATYHTNGGHAIPKVIFIDPKGHEVGTWGPRPAEAQQLVMALKDQEATMKEKQIALRNWYTENKSMALIEEVHDIFKNL
jgi:hypothetical protein